MNREIKFRLKVPSSEILSHEQCLERGYSWRVLNDPDRFIAMQYTGLKDKNGVEIYEGDIVVGNKRFHAEWVTQSAVEFQDGCFGVTDAAGGDFWPLRDFEGSVRGNIYTTPELVETSA